MTRDTNFYSELKQLNEDLFKLIEATQKKSPYCDFTPTLNDYIRQFKEIDQKYPAPSLFSFINNTTTNNSFVSPFSSVGSTTTTTTPFTSTLPFSTAASAVTTLPFSTGITATAPSLFSTTLTNAATNVSIPGAVPSGATDTNIPSATALEAGEEDVPPPEPNVDRYEEPDAKFQVRCKLYERGKGADGTALINLMGYGVLFVKSMDQPQKLQVIFRQDPDLRKVLLNEIITPQNPVKQVQKTVQMLMPGPNGETKFYFAKVKDEKDSNELFALLQSIKN